MSKKARLPGVQPAIAESVADANLKVTGEAPAEALGSLYQALSHSTGLSFANAGNSQQQHFMAAQSATVEGVSQLFTLAPAQQSVAASNINLSQLPEFMTAIVGTLEAFNENRKSVRDDESITVDNRTFVRIDQTQEP